MVSHLNADDKDLIAKRIAEKEQLRMAQYRQLLAKPIPVPAARLKRHKVIHCAFA